MNKITTNNNLLLYPDAVQRIHKDLEIALTNWDYLSSVGGEGPIAEFESAFVKAVGGQYAIALTNATSALYVALMSLGIGRGDEIILPSYTWPQTLTPVIVTGATPVFADIEKDAVTVSPKSVAALISKKTRAIIGVHLFGFPADVYALEEIARRAKCHLIYDAAQGFGSFYDSKPVGSYGDFSAFSFGRSKLFSIGEGGALICRTRDLYERAIAFSQHPLRMHKDVDNHRMRESIDGVSMNFRMHPLIASLALGQLKGLNDSNECRRLRATFMAIYKKAHLAKIKNYFSKISAASSPSGVAFPIILKDKKDRSSLQSSIEDLGLEIYEGGTQKPLHLSSTIQQHKLLSQYGLNSAMISEHHTHIKGSCPKTEERCRLPQLFLREGNGRHEKKMVTKYAKRNG